MAGQRLPIFQLDPFTVLLRLIVIVNWTIPLITNALCRYSPRKLMELPCDVVLSLPKGGTTEESAEDPQIKIEFQGKDYIKCMDIMNQLVKQAKLRKQSQTFVKTFLESINSSPMEA
ncbi:uncharacterized protein LOC144318267 isoform X5 [Canis aureus]